jgi:hypothetical protein
MAHKISLNISQQNMYDFLNTDYITNIIINELHELLVNPDFINANELNEYLFNNNFMDGKDPRVLTQNEFNELVTEKDIRHVSWQISQHFRDRMNISIRFLIERVKEEFFKYLYSEKIDRIKKTHQDFWKIQNNEYGALPYVPIKILKRRPDLTYTFSYNNNNISPY